jgi:nicotinate-nucleotide adenylyltransferase
MKIGLYGGTFDPVHHGHLILARHAAETLCLDRVIFIPNAISPHKQHREAAPADLRLAMVRTAIAAEPRMEVDDIELRRTGPSFTIDTVTALKQAHGQADFCYFIGADNLRDLNTWHRIDDLMRLVDFVVLGRGSEYPPDGFTTLDRRIDISATEIRDRIANGRSIRYLVPESVRVFIESHQLYRSPAH